MVIAHLGSGCSVTAVLDSQSVDTTMGLTPTGGVVMGTRTGDLDPGVLLYLLRHVSADRDAARAVEALVNRDSGIAALSGLPNDMQRVRKAAAAGDGRATLALKVFTRSIVKAIGGFCWLLGGLDAIVFTGGVGEHDALTRLEILAGLEGLDVTLDREKNLESVHGLRRISRTASKTAVYVVPAQEDLMIALHVARMARD
jgi:acetate kinase